MVKLRTGETRKVLEVGYCKGEVKVGGVTLGVVKEKG